MTLLEKAKRIKKKYKAGHIYTAEEAELAVAWVKREVSTGQAIEAWEEVTKGSIYAYLAKSLQKAFELGLIKEK